MDPDLRSSSLPSGPRIGAGSRPRQVGGRVCGGNVPGRGTDLNTQVERLTREGELQEAVRLSARAKEMDKLIAEGTTKTGSGPLGGIADKGGEVLWEFKSRANVESVKNCDLKTVPNGFQIFSESKDGARYDPEVTTTIPLYCSGVVTGATGTGTSSPRRLLKKVVTSGWIVTPGPPS